MFGVVVFGLQQDLRFVYLDEHLEKVVMSQAVDGFASAFLTPARRAEFAFLPLIVMTETYRCVWSDQLCRIGNESIVVDIADMEETGVTLITLMDRYSSVRLEMVKHVLRLCFGPLLAAGGMEAVEQQSHIARRLLKALLGMDLCMGSRRLSVGILHSNDSLDMDRFYVTTAKILHIFLELFFEDSVDGLVYVECEQRTKFYGSHQWNPRVLFLLVRMTCVVDNQTPSASRFTAFMPIDGDGAVPAAVDIYIYKLSTFCYVFGFVRMKHSDLLALVYRLFVNLEKTRLAVCRDGKIHRISKLLRIERSALKSLKGQVEKLALHGYAAEVQRTFSELSKGCKRKSEDVITLLRRSTALLQRIFSDVYSRSFGSAQRVRLDLFNVCCESLLSAGRVRGNRIRRCVFESVLRATGPKASTFDLDAKAYVFGLLESDLRIQAGDADVLNDMLAFDPTGMWSELYCIRRRKIFYILMKGLYRQGTALLVRGYVDGRHRTVYGRLIRRLGWAREPTDNIEYNSTAFVVAAYDDFVNLSLAVAQTADLARKLFDTLEQSWQFRLVRNA